MNAIIVTRIVPQSRHVIVGPNLIAMFVLQISMFVRLRAAVNNIVKFVMWTVGQCLVKNAPVIIAKDVRVRN